MQFKLSINSWTLVILSIGFVVFCNHRVSADFKIEDDHPNTFHRIKRGIFDFLFKSKSTTTTTTTTTTTSTPQHENLQRQPQPQPQPQQYRLDDPNDRVRDTDDEDLISNSAFEGSSESSTHSQIDGHNRVIDYYHCKFVIGEPYIEAYSNPNSDQFHDIANKLTDGIQEIFGQIKGVQSVTISKIEKYDYDSFACRVSADFGTHEFYDSDILNRTLYNYISSNRRIRSITVQPDGYQFFKFPSNSAELENEPCLSSQLRCNSGECLPIEFRCNSVRDCADGSDEFGCDPNRVEQSTKSANDLHFTIETTSITFEDRCRSDDKVRCGNLPIFVCMTNFCDGIPDCPNEFDELNCTSSIHECADNEVQCDDHLKCLPKSKFCDGVFDCEDLSDEHKCTLPITERPQSVCTVSEFRCNQHECIPRYQLCDRVAQCSNGEDERGCKYECASNEFRCNDDTCIPNSAHCNRVYDCPDKSDESFCEQNCTNSEFKCANDVCIDRNYVCNGRSDCSDGSDEINCNHLNQVPSRDSCKIDEFQCHDGVCIDKKFRCDSINDCFDKSDEKNCDSTDAKEPCRLDEYICEDGTCISPDKRCDGRRDCPDGYDELNCRRECNHEEFRCDNITCIPSFKRCDRVKDCPNGNDELNCQTTCSSQEHTCGDGKCLPKRLVCNGVAECVDASDELNCGCTSDEFTCGTGECIKSFLQCNGKRDCVDGSDEVREYCHMLTKPPPVIKCPSHLWTCLNGECISPKKVCDRQFDCNDRSDENNCQYYINGKGCLSDMFRCENGPCINRTLRCNGQPDCPFDNSDELDCHFKNFDNVPNIHIFDQSSTNELDVKTYPNQQDIKENVIKEGREVVFQCRDEGQLRANVRWTRPNGAPLPVGSRDLNGRLEIPDIKLSDSGEYICEAVNYRSKPGSQKTVTLNVQKYDPPQSGPVIKACAYDEATCGNGQCISKSSVCDGKMDCVDGSDENRCSINGCEPNEFRCQNKKCILKIWRCDGDYDCDDKSDEQDCDRLNEINGNDMGTPCSNYQFYCQRDNKCIPRSYHCDTHRDCSDGSDEIGCSKPVIVTGPTPSKNLTVGDTLIITCRAVGIPTPEVNWRRNWGHVPEKCTSTSKGGFGTLNCPNIEKNDEGAYSCEAISIKGQTFAVPDTLVIVIENRGRICPIGYFNDDATHPGECIKCFCFGNAVDCRSANLFTYHLNAPFETHKVIAVTFNSYDDQIQIEHSPYYDNALSRVDPIGSQGIVANLDINRKIADNQYPYFALPESYLGPMLKSYGGYIKYSVRFDESDELISIPDCIISGNGITLSSKRHNLIKGQDNNVTIRFFHGEWYKQNSKELATREDIMMVLADVQAILINLQYVEVKHLVVTIKNIEIDSAAVTNVGLGKAAYVEQCECPVGYSGHSCEKCESTFYRVKTGPWLGKCTEESPTCPAGFYADRLRGKSCQRCPCPLTSPSNQFAKTCRLDYDGQVTCDCPTGYIGRRCEQCDLNYSGNPLIAGDSCKISTCHPFGCLIQGYDQFGHCRCKEYVTGTTCDQCKENTFSLNPQSAHGCVSCFCMGITDQCSSSNWYLDRVIAPFSTSNNGFSLINYEMKNQSIDLTHEINPKTQELYVNQLSYKPNGIYYWKLPSRFLGNKVTSYGGYLNYTIRYEPTPGGQSSKNVAPDVEIISANDITLMYYHKGPITPNSANTIQVPFFEQYWQRVDGKKADREHLLMALADINSILIKATYTTSTAVTYLSNVEMDVASETNLGSNIRAHLVEQCRCPPGYKGLSCEDCDNGYTRTINGLYLGTCETCNCNGHSRHCDSETGVCLGCEGNTIGSYCEQCAPGYVRTPGASLEEPCHSIRKSERCNCNKAGSLSESCPDGETCQCKSNVEGPSCDRCRLGTFGLDERNSHGCIGCFCSGVSNQCSLSNTFIDQIPIFLTPNGTELVLTDIYRSRHIDRDFTIDASKNEQGYRLYGRNIVDANNLYWSLPSRYLGNQLGSYDGNLEFKQRFIVSQNSHFRNDRDILISGNGITIVWSHSVPLHPDVENKVVVTLSPDGNWYRYEEKRALHIASRDDIMIVLANIDSILVRAVPFENTLETYISDLVLDTVSTGSSLSIRKSKLIESCQCPEGHDGLSCERCKQGYYHDKQDANQTPFGVCKKCPCNGNEHRCLADQNRNVICECKIGFDGNYCERQEIPCQLNQKETKTNAIGVISMELVPSEITVAVGDAVNFTCSYESMHNLTISLQVNDNKAASISPRSHYSIPFQNRAFSIKKTATWTVVLNVPKSLDVICLLHNSANRLEKGKLISKLIPAVYGGNESETRTTSSYPSDRPTIVVRISNPSIQIVEVGQRVSLNCSARSVYSAPLRIYWRKEAGELPPGRHMDDNNGILVIINIQISDSGVYVCHADDGHVIMTDKTTLTVGGNRPTQPKVVIYPTELTVLEGNPIEVLCRAIGTPEPNLRWIKSNGFMNPDHDFNNGQFRIPHAQQSDDGDYRCIATNTYGSSDSTVRIRVEPRVSISTNRPIITPTVYEGPEGKDIVLTCRSLNSKPDGINWYRISDARLPYSTIIDNGVLTIRSPRAEDSGIYVCNATSFNNDVTRNEVSVTVISQGTAPTAQINRSEQMIGQGTNSDITCVVSGSPTPTVKWIRNGAEFDSNVKQIDNVLHFENAQLDNRGHYICIANNYRGEAQTSVLVEIERREMPVVQIHPEGVQTVNVGNSVVMQCRATGIPSPVIKWSRAGGAPITKNIEKSSDPRILRLTRVEQSDSGEYICTADNNIGRNTARTQLIIQVPPNVHISPSLNQLTVRKGDRFSLTCTASGSPVPNIRWSMIDNGVTKNLQHESSQPDESTYTVLRANDEHTGSYSCEGHSSAGIDRKYINVIVSDHEIPRGDIPDDHYDDSRENSLNPIVVDNHGSREFLAPVNKNAVIRCHIEGNNEPVLIEWKRAHNVPLPENSYSRDGTLYIPNIQPSATGEYICFGTFPKGQQMDFSRTYLRITFPPSITLDPPKQYVQPGNQANIVCKATGDQPIEINWSQVNGSLNPHSVRREEGLLRFPRITVSDAGRYICTASNHAGTATAVAEVLVEDHGSITAEIRPENDMIQVMSGETAILRCVTQDYYLNSIVWSREGFDNLPITLKSDGPTLIIPNAQLESSGVYKCQISTNRGPKSAYIQLNVTHCRDHFLNNDHDLSKCDFCTPNPCEHRGLCQKSVNSKYGYICTCESQFYGDRCEYRFRQFCGPKTCGSGKCIEKENSYECYCPFRKTGLNCERDIDIVEPAFSENSYLTYPAPPKKPNLSFDLRLKPASLNDGIILYCGQNDQGHGDFASISIKDKHIEFRFDFGSGPIILKSNRPLMPYEWITVTAGRSTNENLLVINNDKVTSNNGNFANSLNLKTPLYVGGYNEENVALNEGVGVQGGFRGCIVKVNMSGDVLNLTSAFRDAANVQDCAAISKNKSACDSRPCSNGGVCYDQEGSQEQYQCQCQNNYSGRNCEIEPNVCYHLKPCQNGGSCRAGDNQHYTCDCNLGFTGMNCEQSATIKSDVHFNGRGYLEISKHYLSHDNVDENEMIALELSTNSTEGLILWHGQEPSVSGTGQDYLSLSIKNGYFEFRFDLGSGEAILQNSQLYISDGNKHRVILKRQKWDASIEIDDVYVEFGSVKDFDDSLDCSGNIYLGGLPNIEFMTAKKFSNGFNGCIHALEIQNSNTLDLGTESLSGVNVDSCSTRYMKQQQRNVNENTDLNEDFNETDYDNYDHDPDRDRFVN